MPTPRRGVPVTRETSTPREDPIGRLRRRLLVHRDRLATLLEGLADGHGDPEELHEWHRELKRLRLDAGLWVPLVPRGRTTGFAELDQALRDLARRIGAVRNDDVSIELLGRLSRGRAPRVLPRDALILTHSLIRSAHSGRSDLAGTLRRAGGPALVTAFEKPLAAALPSAANARLRRAIDEGLVVRLARLERALARAYRRPTVARLHRLRIALRTARILEQTRRAVLDSIPAPVSPRLRRLQVELGELHDLEVLRGSAGRRLTGERRERVGRALRRERRARRRTMVRRLGAKPLRRDWERLLAAAPG